MDVLGLKIPEENFFKDLETKTRTMLSASAPYRDIVLKLILIRREGGIYTPKSDRFDTLLYEDRTPREQKSIKEYVLFSETVRLYRHPLSRSKTCNALPYVLAGLEKKQSRADDLVLLDTEGHVSECTASNLFWIKDGSVFTPDLRSGCIEGVMRRTILEACKKLSVPFEEVLTDKRELLQADFVFTSNVSGLVPVRGIEKNTFSAEHRLFEKIKNFIDR